MKRLLVIGFINKKLVNRILQLGLRPSFSWLLESCLIIVQALLLASETNLDRVIFPINGLQAIPVAFFL